jgi:hypothetical protein
MSRAPEAAAVPPNVALFSESLGGGVRVVSAAHVPAVFRYT